MGPLAGPGQVKEVRHNVKQLATGAELVFGNPDHVEVVGADAKRGAFFPTLLFYSKDSFGNAAPHDVEAFGRERQPRAVGSYQQAIESGRAFAGTQQHRLDQIGGDVAVSR